MKTLFLIFTMLITSFVQAQSASIPILHEAYRDLPSEQRTMALAKLDSDLEFKPASKAQTWCEVSSGNRWTRSESGVVTETGPCVVPCTKRANAFTDACGGTQDRSRN